MNLFQCRLLPLVVELPGWWFEGPPCSIWGKGVIAQIDPGLPSFPQKWNVLLWWVEIASDPRDILRFSSLCTPLKTFILASTKNQLSNEAMKISLVSVFCFHSFQVGNQVLKISKDLVLMWFPHFKLALMALGSQVVKILDLIFRWFPLFKLTSRACWREVKIPNQYGGVI